MKKIYLIMMFALLLIPIVFAEVESLGVVKQNDCVTLKQSCASCSYVKVSAITYPNKTTINNLWDMTNDGIMYNYTFCDTDELGQYIVDGYGDVDGTDTGFGYDFEVTSNGKSNASGGVVVLFSIIFLILVGLTCYLVIYTIGHFVKADFDIIDLAIDWGLFFMIIALYYLENFYLGNKVIEEYLIWFMSAGGILLILVPLIALIFSIVKGSFDRKNTAFRVPGKFGGLR